MSEMPEYIYADGYLGVWTKDEFPGDVRYAYCPPGYRVVKEEPDEVVLSLPNDNDPYEYDSYTTGRKQDWGHHTLNEENGWQCYDWDRGDYTETMEMKRPKQGRQWLPFRVYTSAGRFKDFAIGEEAQTFVDTKPSLGRDCVVTQVDPNTGKETND